MAKVENAKILVVEDIIHNLILVLRGSGMDVDVDEEELEQFANQYRLPYSRGRAYLPHDYISSLGVDGFVFEYAWKRHNGGYYGGDRDESEVAFVGKGLKKLNQSISGIWVDGKEYDITDKRAAMRDIKKHLRENPHD